MAKNEISIGGFLGIEIDAAENALIVRLRDKSNNVYPLTTGAGYLGGLITGLSTQASRLQGAASNQPMTLHSTQPFTMADGGVGLMMVLENGGVRLPVLFPRNAIQSLRNSMDILESHSTEGPANPPSHH